MTMRFQPGRTYVARDNENLLMLVISSSVSALGQIEQLTLMWARHTGSIERLSTRLSASAWSPEFWHEARAVGTQARRRA